MFTNCLGGGALSKNKVSVSGCELCKVSEFATAKHLLTARFISPPDHDFH